MAVVDATHGSRLLELDQAGVYSDLLDFPEGEDTDARSGSEVTQAFRQLLSFIASLFLDTLPSESQPPKLAAWFQGFGDERRKEPRVYLSCFGKIKDLMTEIDRKVTVNAKDQQRCPSCMG